MTATLPVMTAATDVIVQLDVYPADALLADVGTTFLNVRTTIADGVAQVWRWESAGPAAVFTGTVLAVTGDARTGWTITTDNGTVITGFSGGCACGAQLGTAQLWPGKLRVNVSLY